MLTRKGLLICSCTWCLSAVLFDIANSWKPMKNLIVPHIRMRMKETGINTNFSSTATGGGSA